MKSFTQLAAKMKSLFTLFTLVLMSGCSYSIHQQYIGSMDPNASYGKGKWVEVTTSDFVILSFATQSNYVENAYRRLENECKGRIAQVTTEHLTAYKFLSYDQKLVLKGLCQS